MCKSEQNGGYAGCDVQQATIQPIIERFVVPGTNINTDEYNIYSRLTEWGYLHQSVCHGHGKYSRDDDSSSTTSGNEETPYFNRSSKLSSDSTRNRNRAFCFFRDTV